MAWTVETSDEFDQWWSELDRRTQDSLAVVIGLLQRDGPMLPRPYSDKLKGSKIDLRELRDAVYDERNVEHVYRILYAFDRSDRLFSALAGTSRTTGGGMIETSAAQSGSSRSTWKRFGTRKRRVGMAKDFNDLLAAMSSERQADIARRVEEIHSSPLYRIRKALQFTQEQVAEELGLGQAAVSRLERRSDMLISTLRRFVGAMGGELEIRARFPNGDVVIDDLGSLSSDGPSEPQLA